MTEEERRIFDILYPPEPIDPFYTILFIWLITGGIAGLIGAITLKEEGGRTGCIFLGLLFGPIALIIVLIMALYSLFQPLSCLSFCMDQTVRMNHRRINLNCPSSTKDI
jgi:hypothetical protein